MSSKRQHPHRVMPPRRKAALTHDPDALRWALKTAGHTQLWLAEQLGISKGHVSEIVNGTRGLTSERLEQTARLLGCPVGVLSAKAAA